MKFSLKQLQVVTKDEKDEEIENSEYDYIEETIGAIGIWQVVICATVCLTRYLAIGNMTAIVFLTPVTKFSCISIIDDTTVTTENMTCYKNCSKYTYHSDVMETTLISEFGLICERSWLASFTQTILMLGLVIGVSLFGWMSDRFGRRVALLVSTVLNIGCLIPTSFVNHFWMFNTLRFISGVATGGSLIISTPIMMEIIGKKYREGASAISILPDGFAESSLALFAYFLPTWNWFLLGFSLTCTLFLILICFVPESPRWLISVGRTDDAVRILERAAKLNNLNTTNIKEIISKEVEAMNIKENEKISPSYIEFFKTKKLRYITLSTLCVWAVVGTTYYGIYQYVTLLSDNVFISVAIMGLMQLPLCPTTYAITKLCSRKSSLIAPLTLTGVTMILLIFTPRSHWLTSALGIVGFAACSVSFAVIFLYEAELYPTRLRNMAFGVASAAAKIGAMVAPFIANISPTWIPSVLFGGMSMLAALSCLMLPETKGKKLKDIHY